MCISTSRAVLENGKPWDHQCECLKYQGMGVELTENPDTSYSVAMLIITLFYEIPGNLPERLSFLSKLKDRCGTVTFYTGEPFTLPAEPITVKIGLDSRIPVLKNLF